jgi:hypothetical protein
MHSIQRKTLSKFKKHKKKRKQHNWLPVLLHSEIPLFGWTAGQDVTSDGVINSILTKTRLVAT